MKTVDEVLGAIEQSPSHTEHEGVLAAEVKRLRAIVANIRAYQWEQTYNAALTGFCSAFTTEQLDEGLFESQRVDLHQAAWNQADQRHGMIHGVGADTEESSVTKPANDYAAVMLRLAQIEGLLNEVLQELRGRRRRTAKRTRTVHQRAYEAALKHPVQPTELQMAAARRALAKLNAKRRNKP